MTSEPSDIGSLGMTPRLERKDLLHWLTGILVNSSSWVVSCEEIDPIRLSGEPIRLLFLPHIQNPKYVAADTAAPQDPEVQNSQDLLGLHEDL